MKYTYEAVSFRGGAKLSAIYDYVATACELTEADRESVDGQGNCLYKHEVRWCLQTLKHQGNVANGPETGYWHLP